MSRDASSRCVDSSSVVHVKGAATRQSGAAPLTSPAKAEPLDQGPVAVDVLLRQVVQQPAALTDQEQQATTAVVVVLVLLQVLGQLRDAVRQQRDLDLGGAGVTLGQGVLTHDLLLRGGINR